MDHSSSFIGAHLFVSSVPPNVRFEIDDIEEEWTYSEPFNYIHSRFMNASIANWKEYLKKCYELVFLEQYPLTCSIGRIADLRLSNIAPGGYLELLENQVGPVSDDNTLPKDSSIHGYVSLIRSGSEKMGRVFVDVSTLKSLVIEAGFVDVELRIFKWPMNGWPKDEKYVHFNDTFFHFPLDSPSHWGMKHVSSFLRSGDILKLTPHVPCDRYKKLGLWCHENFSSALEGVCMALLTRVHGWTRDEVDVFLVNVRKDLKNRSYHAYFPL